MALIDEIQGVKLGGVSLLSASITTSGGQKSVVHESTNTNKTSIEDLGKSLEEFTVDAIISGNNYVADLRALISVLDSGGEKDFTHKTLGTFRVNVLLPYTVSETEGNFGVADIRIKLKRVNTEDLSPAASSPDEAKISQDSKNVEEMSAAAVENEVTDLPGAVSKQSFVDKLFAFVDDMDKAAADFQKEIGKVQGVVNDVSSRIDRFATTINLIKGAAFSLIRSPLAVGRSIQDVFSSFDALINDPVDAFSAYKTLFRFGADDIPTPNNTLDYIARQQNINVTNTDINAIVLARAYERASQIDFKTVADLEQAQADLEVQYKYLLDQTDILSRQSVVLTRASGSIFRSEDEESIVIGSKTLISASGGVDFDTADDLVLVVDQLRSDARLFFNKKRLTTPQVITIDAPIAPAAVISYMIYGSTEFTEDLLALNDTNDTLVFGGRGLKAISS